MNASVLPHIKLCILIPCYDNFEGLLQSLSSIVYIKENFLVVIVDDGSAHPFSLEDIRLHIPDLTNVKIIRLEKNTGITRALNTGLEFIYNNYDAQFIARLDCGDICTPERFFTQLTFFDRHPEVHLTGSWCYFKDYRTGEAYRYSTPTLHRQIEREMYFRNVFIHPTVMWRNEATAKWVYPEQYPCAEDYGLFYDMIAKLKSAVIDECLVTCQINPKGISAHYRSTQLKSRLRVIADHGKNKWLLLMGALKLNLLMVTPYRIIFSTKKMLYKAT